jgi:hypothetical protein
MIIGINLVSAKFDESGSPIQYRIEPTNGVTDPKLHNSPWVLKQDDREFYAVLTGLGAMGVIYSVTITTVPFYWVRELRQIVDWSTAKKLLAQGPQGDILKYHNAEVWVNPYTSDTLLTLRETTTTQPAGTLAGPSLNMWDALVKALPALQIVANHIFPNFDPSKELGIVLGRFLKCFPLLVPPVSSATCQSLFTFSLASVLTIFNF